MNNEQIIFNKYPDGMPQDDTFKYEEIDTKDPQSGEIQLKHCIFQLIRICEVECHKVTPMFNHLK